MACVVDSLDAVNKVLRQLDRAFECCIYYDYDAAYEQFLAGKHEDVQALVMPGAGRAAEFNMLDANRDAFCTRLCAITEVYNRFVQRKLNMSQVGVSGIRPPVTALDDLPEEFYALLDPEHVRTMEQLVSAAVAPSKMLSEEHRDLHVNTIKADLKRVEAEKLRYKKEREKEHKEIANSTRQHENPLDNQVKQFATRNFGLEKQFMSKEQFFAAKLNALLSSRKFCEDLREPLATFVKAQAELQKQHRSKTKNFDAREKLRAETQEDGKEVPASLLEKSDSLFDEVVHWTLRLLPSVEELQNKVKTYCNSGGKALLWSLGLDVGESGNAVAQLLSNQLLFYSARYRA